jgi:hypothetical protein
MDRAGRKASQLSSDEMAIVFELLSGGKSSEDARRLLRERGRDRNTVNRLYNVVKELEARDLDTLDHKTVQEIADAARYSTTVSYVQGVHLRWRAWKNRTTRCDDLTHQEFLRDCLVRLELELRPLQHSFPGVFRLSYQPEDSANRLKWLEENGIKRLKWELEAEQQLGWSLVQQHLKSGMPEVAQAITKVKRNYAMYCLRLITLEDTYREKAKEEQAQATGSLKLNDSHFYRSILAEVDKSPEPEEQNEYTHSGGPAILSVAFDGVELITQAEDRTTTQRWVELHQQWRREIRWEHLAELLNLRREIKEAARIAVAGIDRLEQGGPVPGRCNRFP